MLAGACGEQPGTHRRLHGQVERLGGEPRRQGGGIAGGHLPGRRFRQYWLRERSQHSLARLAGCGHGEDGAQHLVPGGHVRQRGGQRGPVQLADEPHHHRDVIGRAARVQLPQEPDPPLRERDRQRVGPPPGPERGPRGARRAVKQRRQPRGRRRVEQGTDRQLAAENGAHPARHPHREQRVPAQLEEIIERPYPVQAKDVGEDAAQQLFPHRGGPRPAPAR